MADGIRQHGFGFPQRTLASANLDQTHVAERIDA